MADPLISIIVPCYNYGNFLAEGLNSVAAQTYVNWECIVVDDGSKDDTKNVASAFTTDPRFRYIYQDNQGLSAARNTGIRSSKGDWIHFMDADDVIHPQKFKVMVDHAKLNPSAAIVFTDYQFFDVTEADRIFALNKQRFDEGLVRTEIIHPSEACLQFLKGNFLATNGPMISSAHVRSAGLFDTSFRALEDWDYWFRLAINGGVFLHIILPVTLSWMRKHGTNMSKQYDNMLSSHARLLRKMKVLFEAREPGNTIPDRRLFMSTLKRDSKFFPSSIIFEEIQLRKFWTGIRLATVAVLRSPNHFRWYLEHGLYSIKVRLQK